MSKEINVQTPSEEKNTIFFSIIKQLSAWFIPISIVFGGLSVYSYFSFIGITNFLPEIIGQTSVFISIFMIFLIFTLLISTPFLSSFWLTITIRKNKFYIEKEIKKFKNHINFVTLTLYFPIIILFLYIIFLIFNFDEKPWGQYAKDFFIILFLLFSPAFFSICYFLKNKKYNKVNYPYKYRNKFTKEVFLEISIPLILYSVYSTPILFITSATWFAHEEEKLWMILIPLVPLTLNIFTANMVLFKEKGRPNNTQNMNFFFIIPILIIFICIIMISVSSENLPRSMLNKI